MTEDLSQKILRGIDEEFEDDTPEKPRTKVSDFVDEVGNPNGGHDEGLGGAPDNQQSETEQANWRGMGVDFLNRRGV